jgi:6-phosphogluconolactonase (cycloisomerase 2 family)
MFFAKVSFVAFLMGTALLASATTPVVTIQSPANGSVASPVSYVASAASPGCSKGIAAMRIYTAPGVGAYTIDSNTLNTNINLPTGSYQTVVQAWDNCGGVGKTAVNITVSKINLAPPKFLYATEFAAGRIAEYVVNPLTGSISPTRQSSTWAHWGPVDIASDPGGYRLYVANQGSHDMNAYFINRNDGSLASVPGSPFAIAGVGERIVVHPSGHFIYVTSYHSGGTYDVNAFHVQSNGSLQVVPGSPFSGEGSPGLAALAMDPKGKYLFAAASVAGNAGAVAAFIIDPISGAITPVAGSPFIIPNYPGCTESCSTQTSDVAVGPTGKYLYAVLPVEDAIAGFSIDPSTGALSSLAGSPYPEARFCNPLGYGCNSANTESIDPNGKFIYVANDELEALSIFTINPATGVPAYAGDDTVPCWQAGFTSSVTVNVDPSGTFLYSLGATTECGVAGTTAVLGLSINQGTGDLISVPGSPFANPDVHTTRNEEKAVVTR